MPDRTRKSAAVARPAAQPDEVALAFQRTEKDIRALEADRVGQVTADIPTAVALALGALPQIEALVPAMKDALKEPPLGEIARLRDRALATLYAHLHFVPKTKVLDDELEEARLLREQLLASADAHVKHGQLEEDAVAKIREGSGHLDRANDLIALSALFRSAWAEVAGRTQVTTNQIERASVLGTLLVAELGGRALGTGATTGGQSWSDDRNRAFRLFVSDYDQIRRAVEYVRWNQDDGAAYAPPLHQRKRGGKGEGETPAGGGTPTS